MNDIEKVDQQKKYKRMPGYLKVWRTKRKEVEDSGLIIKVRHDRVFKRNLEYQVLNPRALDENSVDAPLVIKKSVNDILVMTKGELYKDFQLAKQFEIQNHGGCTTISLYKGEELVATGRARVSVQDQFIRHKGLAIALSQAMEKL